MEREFDEQLDGTGGGFGRYSGVSLKEMSGLFEACRRDPTMRGVSAVLRIAREQLDARGGLGTYPWLAGSAFGAAILLVGISFVCPPMLADKLRETSGALAVVGVLFASLAYSLRLAMKKALYQEQQIRTMALDTLVAIVREPGFAKKPLDSTQRLTLERLLKQTRRTEPEIADLLR